MKTTYAEEIESILNNLRTQETNENEITEQTSEVEAKLNKPFKTVNDGSGKMAVVSTETTEKDGNKKTTFKTETTNKKGEPRTQNDKGFNNFEEAAENLDIDLQSEENETELELVEDLKESRGSKGMFGVRVTEVRENTDKSSPFFGTKTATVIVGSEKIDFKLKSNPTQQPTQQASEVEDKEYDKNQPIENKVNFIKSNTTIIKDAFKTDQEFVDYFEKNRNKILKDIEQGKSKEDILRSNGFVNFESEIDEKYSELLKEHGIRAEQAPQQDSRDESSTSETFNDTFDEDAPTDPVNTPETAIPDTEEMELERSNTGETISSNDLMAESKEKDHPGSNKVEMSNGNLLRKHSENEGYLTWLYAQRNKVGTKVQYSITNNWNQAVREYMEDTTGSSAILENAVNNGEILAIVLDENGVPEKLLDKPVQSYLWRPEREGNPIAKKNLINERRAILQAFKRGENPSTTVGSQMHAAFNEIKGANHSLTEVFNQNASELPIGVVNKKGRYATMNNTSESDPDLGGYPAKGVLAGRLYIKVPSNVNEKILVPAMLNVRQLNNKEAKFIVAMYKQVLNSTDKKFFTQPVPPKVMKAFEELIPNFSNNVLKKAPTYRNLRDFLIVADNKSINADKQFFLSEGALHFGGTVVNKQNINSMQPILIEFLTTNIRRRVDIKAFSNNPEYRAHIVNEGILTTDIVKPPGSKFKKGTYDKDTKKDLSKFKGSVYLNPILNKEADDLTKADEQEDKAPDPTTKTNSIFNDMLSKVAMDNALAKEKQEGKDDNWDMSSIENNLKNGYNNDGIANNFNTLPPDSNLNPEDC